MVEGPIRTSAEHLLSELNGFLPEAVFLETIEKGKQLDIEATVAELLDPNI